ncbi:MAG: TIM barrel protein [Clostridia bacterium]|nr:TIM barrel protein [Clostridia bacterium]
MKAGFTLFNFCSVIKSAQDLDAVLARLEEMGVGVVQISGIGSIPYPEAAKLCRKHNMEVCVTHSPVDRILNDTDALIEEHKLLGCSSIGLGWMPEEYHSAEGVKKFISDFTVPAKKMKAAGMQFVYHNHAFEFERYDGRLIMDVLIEDSDPELFNFIMDIHWLQAGGVYPPDYIRKVSGRMKICHFKDYRIVDNERDFAEVGTGNLDLDACYMACVDAGAEYIIIEQDRCRMDLFDSAKISWTNLNKLLEKYS